MTVFEPSTITFGDDGERFARARVVLADQVRQGDIVTNRGIVDAVRRDGVFVIASIRGTVWSLTTGTGDIHNFDVIWHETQDVSVDVI